MATFIVTASGHWPAEKELLGMPAQRGVPAAQRLTAILGLAYDRH